MSDASSPSLSREPKPWEKGLIAVALIVVVLGVFLLVRPSGNESVPSPTAGDIAASGPTGAPIKESSSVGAMLGALEAKPMTPGEGIPTDILEEMQRCLRAPELSAEGLGEPKEASATPDPVRVLRTEEALVEIEKDLGPAMMQGDLWTDWIVRLPEGMDRKVHLENIEDEGGRIRQNLSLFQIDQSGKAMRIPLTEAEELNPDMVMISNLLNEGEIHRKETSRYYQFAGGERLELIELDGQPTELEIVRGEIFFRCDKMEGTENCTCIR